MKMLLSILIMVIKICASESSVYDWHVKTIETKSEFGNDLKRRATLDNERRDLFKATNGQYDPNFDKNPFNEIFKKKANEATGVKETNINFNVTRKEDSTKDKNIVYGDNKQNNEQKKNYKAKQNGVHSYCDHQPPHTTRNVINMQKEHLGNAKESSVTTSNKYEKKSKKHKEIVCVDHYSGKQIDIESFMGTNLFDITVKRCFSMDDVALLTLRKEFEILIPKQLPQCLFDDNILGLLLNYFYMCHQIIMQTNAVQSRYLAQKAFYDTLGGYLNFYMVPVTKYSYYAGQISLNSAMKVIALQQETRKVLNTNGNGWRTPLKDVLGEFKSVYIEPLYIPESKEDSYNKDSLCMQLDIKRDKVQTNNDKMIVRLPELEEENSKGYLSNIWLPFNLKKTFDLKSEASAYILVNFYEIVTKCYRFENIDQTLYNEQFKSWLEEKINVHLSDEEFYPGLGSILRINEYFKLLRKNFFDISNDLRFMENFDANYYKYRNHQIRSDQLDERKRIRHNKTKQNFHNLQISFDNDLHETNRNNINSSEIIVELQNGTSSTKITKLQAIVQSLSTTSEAMFRSLKLSPTQIIIVAIPVILILFATSIYCCKYVCHKKKATMPTTVKKNSSSLSSSSSNLFKSPVRFFSIRKKSITKSLATEYPSSEVASKKNKISVKSEKIPLINSDSSISSTPNRNKKYKRSVRIKDKGKAKDVEQTNSKSSWETTFSSK